MAISSLGVGSGLELGSLVESLVASEREPVLQRLAIKETNYQTELSAFAAIKAELSAFQTSVSGLTSADNFNTRSATTTDQKVFTATAESDAAAGTSSIIVSRLASAHILNSSGTFTSPSTDTLDGATGTLQFRFGTYTYDGSGDPTAFTANALKSIGSVTIDATNNTLEGIRDAVNTASLGVTASIISTGQDASGNFLHQLVFNSNDTGASNALEITATVDTGGTLTDTTGLSRLAYSVAAQNLTDPKKDTGPNNSGSAVDAALTVNGIGITSSSNEVENAVQGVKLKLISTNVTAETLNVSLNTSVAKGRVEGLVEAYNALQGIIGQTSGYDKTSETSGILSGDFAVRTVQNQVRSIINTTLSNIPGNFKSLAEIGVTTISETGFLEVDSAKLSDAIDSNYDDIADLFAAIGRISDSQISFKASTSDTLAGVYGVNITKLATQGSITGAATASLADTATPGTFDTAFVVDADNDTFTLKVDGVTSNNITISQGSYSTTAALVAQIQSQINGDAKFRDAGVGVSVTFDSTTDKISILSTRFGSASTVEALTVDTNTAAELGLSIAAGTAGVDVVGTINGKAAAGSGRKLTSSEGNSKGLGIEITGGALGDRGNITFTRGIGDQLHTALGSLTAVDGLIFSRQEGIQDSIDEINQDRKDLDLRISLLTQRLTSKFVALDVLLAGLQATSSYLTNQLSSLNNLSNSFANDKI